MYGAHILTIDAGCFQSKGSGTRQNVSGSGFGIVRVLRVEIVLADVDHRQLEKLGEVHHFIQNTLTQSAFSEETDGHAAIAQPLRGKGCSGCDAGTPAHNRVCAQVAGVRIGNVHGTALALAVSGLFSQQFGEHLVGGSAFRQTMSMTAMRAGDVVRTIEGFAYANRDCFLTDIKMRKPGISARV